MGVQERPEILHGAFRTISFFSGLLGFSEQEEFRVEAVTFEKDHFEVILKKGDDVAATLVVGEPRPDTPAFLSTSALSLVYKGDSLPRPVEAILRAGAFKIPPDATMAHLEDVAFGDPDAWQPEKKEVVVKEDTEARFLRKLKTKLAGPEGMVTDPDSFADFLGRYDILCQKVISMWLFNPCTLILHGDSECFGPPNLGLDMVMTITPPWDNRIRNLGSPRDADVRIAEPKSEDLLLYVTDLREKDIIAGSDEKERKIFERVFDEGDDPGVVVFFHACAGVVAGSDIEHHYLEYKEKHSLPVLYFRGGENRLLQDFYKEVLVDVRASIPHPDDAPPDSVNLVGYSGHATKNLLKGLELANVKVNSILLPAVTVTPVVAFEEGSVNIFLPNVDFENFYDQLREQTKIPTQLVLDAPYGVEGTKWWYRQVAKATGHEAEMEEAIETLLAASIDEWEALRTQARGQRLAIVARDFEVEHLLHSQYTYGVPVLRTLLEMGFDIDLLLMKTDPEFTAWAKKRLQEAGVLQGGELAARITLGTFETQAEMMDALGESSAGAVFSNLFFDWRAHSAGKATFSLQYFEAGFDGAVRSLRRLLKVAGTPFYSRYAHYLKRDAAGRLIA